MKKIIVFLSMILMTLSLSFASGNVYTSYSTDINGCMKEEVWSLNEIEYRGVIERSKATQTLYTRNDNCGCTQTYDEVAVIEDESINVKTNIPSQVSCYSMNGIMVCEAQNYVKNEVEVKNSFFSANTFFSKVKSLCGDFCN